MAIPLSVIQITVVGVPGEGQDANERNSARLHA